MKGEQGWVSLYTLLHFLTGVKASKYIGLGTWLTLHTLFEIWENSESGIELLRKEDDYIRDLLDRLNIDIDLPSYEGDSLKNTIGDTVASVIGWKYGVAK
jgi:hypothetical protein